jgi:hypothetical protein
VDGAADEPDGHARALGRDGRCRPRLDRLISSGAANYFVSPLATTVVYMAGLAALVSRVIAREGAAVPGE